MAIRDFTEQLKEQLKGRVRASKKETGKKPLSDPTLHTGLLGDSSLLSVFPYIMNKLYEAHGLDYTYDSFHVEKDEFPAVLDEVISLGFKGFNVSDPGQAITFYLCDRLEHSAKVINYADTVVIEDDHLIGHNTKGYGFKRAAEKTGIKIKNSSITIFGCGETAQAIASKCAESGAAAIYMIVEPKDPYRLQAAHILKGISEKTKCRIIFHDPAKYGSVESDIKRSQIIVNATTIGSISSVDQTVVDTDLIKAEHTVIDTVIYPHNTLLLRQTAAKGCRYATGVDICLYQAAASFKIFTGLKALEADLRPLLPTLYQRTLYTGESQE